MKKNLIILVIASFFVVIALSGCSTKKEDAKGANNGKQDNTKNTKKENIQKDSFKDFVLKGVENGKKVWQLTGTSAFFNLETSDQVEVTNPEIFFYELDKMSSRVKAEKALVNTKTKDMHAIGKVEMFSLKEDTKLYTEEVFFTNSNSTFFSDKYVKIERGNGSTTEGVGFDATSDLSVINIKKDVVMKYKEDNIKK